MNTPHVETREDVRARARATLDAIKSERDTATPPEAVPASATTPPVVLGGLEMTAMSNLLAESDETVDYLVEDRIACGSVNLLGAKPKTGKSTMARALAFEVSRGGRWLGRKCQARPVLYLALEDMRSEIRRHFHKMGATGAEPLQFVFGHKGDDLVAQLSLLAARERPGLIVIDTLQRLIKAKDLNDYAEVTTKLTPILDLARDTGAAVLLVHHAGKSERAGIDAVLGSTALTGSVDNVFILSRTDRYRVLSSTQRIGPDMPETVITLDEATGRIDAGPSRHEADVTAVENAMVAALGSSTLMRVELLVLVEARRQVKLEALRRAVERGTIIRSGAGSKSDPHRYTRGNDTDSGSEVPVYTREPQSSASLSSAIASVSNADCGSHVPTVPEVPQDPRSEHRVRISL